MTNEEKNRLKRLKELKFDKIGILSDYEELDSLQDVRLTALMDFKLVDSLLKEDYDCFCGIHNLLQNFVWYICFSDGTTQPANLWEDDVDGINFLI